MSGEQQATDDRAVPASDRFAFAAYAAFRTLPLEAVKLHWRMTPPEDKERWRRAAAAVLAEMDA